MVLTTWLGTRYVGGGHCIYFGLLNSAVHTVMYFYYLLTSYSEEYKKNLWWKKYLTQMQMVRVEVPLGRSLTESNVSGAICAHPVHIHATII